MSNQPYDGAAVAAPAVVPSDAEELATHLFERYANEIFAYLLRMIGDRETAQDLAQDTFLAAYRARDQIARLENPRAWLYRIAANLVAGHYRKERRRPWLSLDEQDAQHDPSKPPDRVAEDREELVELAQAMAALSEPQRIVLHARYIEALSNAEIAVALGKTEGAVKALQHRALRSLARVLGRQTGPRRSS